MRFGMGQQSAAGARATLGLGNHQRTQQRHLTEEFESHEPVRSRAWSSVEEMFAMRPGEVIRGQLGRGQQGHGCLQRGTGGDGGHQAALFLRGEFTVDSGAQQVAAPSAAEQHLSVRKPTSSFMTSKSAL